MDRASELRLCYSLLVGVRILHPNTIFMKHIFLIFSFLTILNFLFLTDLFNVLTGMTPSLLQSHDLKKIF